jgi:fructose-1,6-bisphosphatase-3
MDEEGNFLKVNIFGKEYGGKALYDILDHYARKGYYSQDKEEVEKGRDIIWYIWTGPNSPVFGKDKMATFERYFVEDKSTHTEIKNSYYRLMDNEEVLNRILREFGLDENSSHIINGHVPVELKKGKLLSSAAGSCSSSMAVSPRPIRGKPGLPAIRWWRIPTV